jgi:hypothetical protein
MEFDPEKDESLSSLVKRVQESIARSTALIERSYELLRAQEATDLTTLEFPQLLTHGPMTTHKWSLSLSLSLKIIAMMMALLRSRDLRQHRQITLVAERAKVRARAP